MSNYIYIYIYICVCVCEREREREINEIKRLLCKDLHTAIWVIYIRQNKISRKVAYNNFKRPLHNILGKTNDNKINCVKKEKKSEITWKCYVHNIFTINFK